MIKDHLRKISLALLMLVALLTACGEGPGENLYGDDPTLEPGLPPQAVLEAQGWLADRLGVQSETVEIQMIEQAEWRDSCLGLGGPDEACLQVITPGWRVILTHGGEEYEVRTNEDGSVIRLAPGGQSANFAGQLINTRWQFESFATPGDESATTAPVPDTNITLIFETEDRATGHGGCNDYSTQYAILFDRITFLEVISTEIACIPQVMVQETRYFEALQTAEAFRLAGDTLTIFYDSETKTLNFNRMAELPPDAD